MGLPGPAARLLEDFTTFEDLPVAISLLTCDGRLLRANARLCELVGRTEPELLGADSADLLDEADRAGAQALLRELVAGTAEHCDREMSYRRPDGAEVPVLVRRATVRDAHGTVALVVEHAVPRCGGDPAQRLSTAVSRSALLLRLAEQLHGDRWQPAEVAAVAGQALHELCGGGTTVFLVDPADGHTVEAAAVRTDDAAAEAELRRLYAQVPLRTDAGFLGEVFGTGRPLVLDEPFAAAPPALTEYLPWVTAHPLRALLLVPMPWQGHVLGVLGAGRHGPEPFTDDELSYAVQVARQSSAALADAQLRALERATARRERAVARVTRRCEEVLGTPDAVLGAAVAAVAAELGGTCCVWLLDDDGRFARAAVRHPDAGVEQTLQAWLPAWAQEDSTFLPAVLSGGRSLLVGRDQVAALAATMPTLAAHADDVAVESLYGVALVVRGQLTGVLSVGSLGGRLTVEDRRLVDVLADRVALALDNAALLTAARSSRSRARALVEHCSDLLLMADAAGAITYASPAAARLFGRRLGDTLMSSVVPEDRPLVARTWAATLARPGLSAPVDVGVVDRCGQRRRLSAVANNLLDDPGVAGVVLTVRDVTEEREATARLAQRAGQQAALAAVGATALTAGLDELYLFVAKTIAETLDSTTSGVLQRLDDGRWTVLGGSDPRFLGSQLTSPPRGGLATVAATGRPVVVEDYLVPGEVEESEVVAEHGLRSGTIAPVLVHGQVWGAVTAHSDEPQRFSSVDSHFLHTMAALVAGAVERDEMSAQVLAQATTDHLTGLPNRVFVQRELERALRADRWDGQAVALLLLDLDDFKDVNDSLGHGAGDQLLAHLACRLGAVVAGKGSLARLGGDEFAVVLAGADAQADAQVLAEDVARSVQEPFALPGIDVTLSGSVGIALAPAHGRDAEQLLQAADMAMYRAKLERSRWALYDAELDSRRSERLTLLSELRVALSTGQLVLHYQPLVDLATERVVEVEALLRWNHPTRGLLLPGAFLPTAEQTDLVHGLTRYVVRAAARQAREWRSAGWTGTVAVNVSALALRPPDVVESLREELLRAGGALTVELTESALVDERAREAVQTLAAAGIACSVDDFGTGWSSLSYLRDLPVTRLKLDRAFNRDVHRDERDAAIVGGVVQMAHAIGLDVVAEGVETAQVAACLREIGCDVAQGWLYGRPQPASALRLV